MFFSCVPREILISFYIIHICRFFIVPLSKLRSKLLIFAGRRNNTGDDTIEKDGRESRSFGRTAWHGKGRVPLMVANAVQTYSYRRLLLVVCGRFDRSDKVHSLFIYVLSSLISMTSFSESNWTFSSAKCYEDLNCSVNNIEIDSIV